MNVFAENVPPKLQISLKMIESRGSINLSGCCVELLIPRLGFSDEVKNFNLLVESKSEKMLKARWDVKEIFSPYLLNAGKYE